MTQGWKNAIAFGEMDGGKADPYLYELIEKNEAGEMTLEEMKQQYTQYVTEHYAIAGKGV